MTNTAIKAGVSIPHFLGGIDFGKMQTASTDHTTAMVSISAPPPQTNPLFASAAWALSYLRFASGTAFVSFIHLAFYVFLFLVTHIWVGIFSKLSFWNADLVGLNPFLFFFPDPLGREAAIYIFIWYLVGFLVIFWFNFFDAFYNFHERLVPVPTWLKYRPWKVKRYLVETWSLHFGWMTLRYGYNDNSFFVLSDTNHVVMMIDFPIIDAVYVHYNADPRWIGNHQTPPVRVVLGRGETKTLLVIHGKYFEENASGLRKAQAFADGLNAKRGAAAPKAPESASPD